MPPSWLQTIAWISLVSAGTCAVIILLDIFVAKHRQKMGVMEWVWPITALYLGVFGLAFYWLVGRRSTPKYEAAHGPRSSSRSGSASASRPATAAAAARWATSSPRR